MTDPEEQRFVHRAAGLLDQSYRGILDLSGKDLLSSLDGVFSSPVKDLSCGQGQASCLLSAKGRLVSAFHLFALPEGDVRLVWR